MSSLLLRCRKHNKGDFPKPLKVLQFAPADGRLAQRVLTEKTQAREIIKGPWQYTPRPFASGLFCYYCLAEGIREPLSLEDDDLHELGLDDPPIVFQLPEKFQAELVIQKMQEAFSKAQLYVRTFEAVPAQYRSDGQTVLDRLFPPLAQATQKAIGPGNRLYLFQEQAIEAALDGHNVVVATPTASGKTFTYLLPIFDTLLQEPDTTALYLSPLVALTEDQIHAVTRFDSSGVDWQSKGTRFSQYQVYRELRIGDHPRSIRVARYDGSVSTGDRQHIRRNRPQYILTTPDMLHMTFLRHAFEEKQWAYFFQGLRYVVLDEIHTYRGVFGASFANLIRRLQRICRAHGSNPQFLCASATLQDPEQTVAKLIGRQSVVVGNRGDEAPRNRRVFGLWSQRTDDDTLRALSTQAKDVLLFLLRERVYTLAFARSIREIMDIYRFVSAELRESGWGQIQVMPFMRELKPGEKREIIRQFQEGTLHAVISTTALSMGIDIGNISAAGIIGFPGSIAQLWQQAGRAGRSGEGVVILIADRSPLDQFFVNHPDILFDLAAEPVYSNPDNPYIVRGHLLCAAGEMPLTPEELGGYGATAQEVAEVLSQEGWLEKNEDGKLHWSDRAHREYKWIPLRNIGFQIDVMTENREEIIVQVDASRAQRAFHKYARYQYIDRYFEVTRFDVDFKAQRGIILVRELEHTDYITHAQVEHRVDNLKPHRRTLFQSYEAVFGQIHSETNVVGYYKVPLFARNEPQQYQPLGVAAPPPFQYTGHALWFALDEECLPQVMTLEQQAGLYSAAEALRLAIAVEELCDPADLIAISEYRHEELGRPLLMVMDGTPGGIGITASAYTKLERVLERALQILRDCPYCTNHPESQGCPQCVTARYGDESTINRQVGIEILASMSGGPGPGTG